MVPQEHQYRAPAATGSSSATKSWIRGVNIGGWLVLERFITPYLFAVTSCHLEGNFCYYPGQIGATGEDYCNLYHCKPHLTESVTGEMDFPVDEYTLHEAFEDNTDALKSYMNRHYDTFVTLEDIKTLKQSGVTHVRVPLGHWILGDISLEEPYVQDDAWHYLTRLVGWCRDAGIEVWPDLHTAPGSQNGFDNSGQLLKGIPTCQNWSNSTHNVERTLKILLSICRQIKEDRLDDVITGLGILNEPFVDCDRTVVQDYNRRALTSVREIMGDDVHIYIGDLFNATDWNDGYWNQEDNTYLDSHYYHVFAKEPRALSPRQHIAYVCEHNDHETVGCCYEDYPPDTSILLRDYDVPYNTKPISNGISRIVGEWSAALDVLPVAMLGLVMASIATDGRAFHLDRELSQERRDLLRNFVQAQMVTYEAVDTGISSGWFFWTLKMEGGAFAEWDFLRGLREGWISAIPSPHIDSIDLYGTCESIISRTNDSMDVIEQYPEPEPIERDANNWQGVVIDDDVVVSHGDSLLVWDDDKDSSTESLTESTLTKELVGSSNSTLDDGTAHHGVTSWFPLLALAFFVYAMHRVFFRRDDQRTHYTQLDNHTELVV